MPWIELGLTCSACSATLLVSLETVERHPVCTHCGKAIPGVEVFRLSGVVYVLSNPSMPGLLKIGYTERDVMERAAEIGAATGVPEPYIVEAFCASANPAADEVRIHTLLGEFRGTRKEFFRVDLQQALDVIYQVCGRKPRYCRKGLEYETPAGRATRKAAVADYISGWTTIYEENKVLRSRGGTLQTPPDLVVKFQPIDIVDTILWLLLRPRVVYQRGIQG